MRGITRHSYRGTVYLRVDYRHHDWARALRPSDPYDNMILSRSDHVLIYEHVDYVRDDNREFVRAANGDIVQRPHPDSAYATALLHLGMTREQVNEACGRVEWHSRRPLTNRHRERLAAGAAARAADRRVTTARIREILESGVTPEATRHSEVATPSYQRPSATRAHLAFLAGGQ